MRARQHLLATAVLLCSTFLMPSFCAVYGPPAPLPANAFVGGNESWFQFPEKTPASNYSLPSLLSRPSFGIALSGGGMRAATVGLGFLRGLHQLGVTDGARYLTSNSGGSWLNAAFSFQQKYPLTTFLGSYIPPQQLTMAVVSSAAPAGSFESAIAGAQLLVPGIAAALQDAVRGLQRGQQQGVGAWSDTVGRAFLQPYDLNSDSSTFTALNTSGPVHQALQALDPSAVQVYTYKPYFTADNSTAGGPANSTGASNSSEYRPYPVMMGAILLQNTPLGFYPFEFTPLYVGIAPYYNDTSPPVGGGYVDPVGFNSPAPSPTPTLPASVLAAFASTNATGFDNGTLLTATNASNAPEDAAGGSGATSSTASNASDTSNTSSSSSSGSNSSAQLVRSELLSVSVKPDYLVPLKVVTGISSSFITNMLQPTREIGRELTGTEVLKYWSPINFTAQNVPFADGGSADNLAVTPLLRRRVRKMVVLVAASNSVTNATDAADWGGYQYDVSGLFGAAPPSHPSYNKDGTITGVPVDLFNRKLQVFPQAAFKQLYDGLKATTQAGGPSYHLANYTVITNNHQAIFGGWQVEVLWVVSQRQTKWEAALPKETADTLSAGQQGSSGRGGGLKGLITSTLHDRLGTDAGGADALGLKGFPFIPTGQANYSPELTKLLSQHANWQMLQLQPQLQQLLQGTNITVKQVAA